MEFSKSNFWLSRFILAAEKVISRESTVSTEIFIHHHPHHHCHDRCCLQTYFVHIHEAWSVIINPEIRFIFGLQTVQCYFVFGKFTIQHVSQGFWSNKTKLISSFCFGSHADRLNFNGKMPERKLKAVYKSKPDSCSLETITYLFGNHNLFIRVHFLSFDLHFLPTNLQKDLRPRPTGVQI